MKILMLSDDYLPNIGGIAAHIYHLSRALQALGHETVIVHPVVGGSGPLSDRLEDDLRVIRVPFRTPRHKLERRWLSNRAARAGLKHALAHHGPFDLLHQHDHLSTAFAARGLAGRLPWVWTNHTSDFLMDMDKALKRRLVAGVYAKAAGVIAVSQELHDKTEALWKDCFPRAYIPNGVDTARFSPASPPDAALSLADTGFVVLCPRRMVPKNGVIYLAQATALVLGAAPQVNWRFVFLGSEAAVATNRPYVEEILATLEPARQRGHVLLLGDVPMARMPGLNAAADLVVMPSLMEAVSLSALEAMATRKPLVATRVGGLPEIVHHEQTGLLVAPRDPQALADAILRLQGDADLRARVAEGGYRLATSSYSWASVAARTADFYERCLRAERPS
jgi:glycosyltransferase involved in cell wall biosynthesis